MMILGLVWPEVDTSGQTSLSGENNRRPPDSIRSVYDSLQDHRMDRVQEQIFRRIRNLESALERNAAAKDSLTGIVQGLDRKTENTDRTLGKQAGTIAKLERELERTGETMDRYQSGLHRFLWITGTVLVILILATFLFLLLHSTGNRKMIEKIRWRQRKLKMSLRALKGEVASDRKKVNEKLKSQRKSILKYARKEVRKRK